MDDRLIDGRGARMRLCRLVTSIASYGRPKQSIIKPRFRPPNEHLRANAHWSISSDTRRLPKSGSRMVELTRTLFRRNPHALPMP